MSHGIPQTPFALLSGSAGWGIRFPDDLEEPGVRVVERGLAFDTPWGRTENWQLIELDGRATADGRPRRFLNVFSHGWPIDAIDHSAHRRVAWVLAQAGVRKVVADSTCGSLNKALRPRDFILPGDVIDFSQTQYSVLDGRFRHLCFANQMFCPALGGVVERIAQALWPGPGRVFGSDTRIVVAHNWGPRFTSRAEASAYRQLGADAINQSIGPEATAAREIGACFVSASYVVCFEDGVVPGGGEALDGIHADLAEAASRISLRSMAQAVLSEDCGCAGYRVERPADYATIAKDGPSGPR